MAEAGISADHLSVNQDHFNCPVCLDILKDPVTTSCGHSFCKVCINGCWDQEDMKGVYSCPQCRKSFTPRPVKHRNSMLAEVVEKLKKTELQAASPAHCYAGSGDLGCDFCTEACLVCQASYCEDHLKPHYQSPAFKKHKLVEACAELQEKICSQHDKLIEIHCHTDTCCLCTMEGHKGHNTVSTKTERTEKQNELKEELVESLQRIQEKKRVEEICEEELNKICPHATAVQIILPSEPIIREDFLQYFCYLTLDPNTASSKLILSEKNRTVTCSDKDQKYPDHPERFYYKFPQVLCKERLRERCYWEVECSSFGDVFISVSYQGICRKQAVNDGVFGYNNLSWCLKCSYCYVSFLHNNTETAVLVPASSRIGVYVDHSVGTLSFYSISDTMKLLHRVHTTFTQPLYAGFCIWHEGTTVRLCDIKN